jgi:hypothetical protein
MVNCSSVKLLRSGDGREESHMEYTLFQTSLYLVPEKYENIFLKYEIFNDGQFTDSK